MNTAQGNKHQQTFIIIVLELITRASFCNFCNFFYSSRQLPKYSECL